ncbi:YhfX family PLP-dependent enzyme [Atlantibacter hermannii]|nr:YhfX family PLP-dependent enzyme [Atlantibacter hermannii]NBC99105.1 YhfX family PLP-dependent enzyme [Atlantibacter hermannii]
MFIDALKRQNPGLIEAAYQLWKQGKILPDSWVIDVDQVIENARLLLDVAHRHGMELYLMTKQIGRNPWLAEKLLALGYSGLVAVDYKEARILRAQGLKVAHQGHLVQIPRSMVTSVLASDPQIITLFSLEKAQEISDAAQQLGREQAVMLKVYGAKDSLYPGQEAGFSLSELDATVEALRALPGIRLAGLTHFPCLLWDEAAQQTRTTPNLDTLLAARERLAQSGIYPEQINAPSANSCATLPLLAQYGVTHAEPGHALTGTLPANQHGDQPERIAMLWLSEISHHFNGTSYCYGGGYYRRGHARNALVFTDDASSPVATTLKPVDSNSIDYHLPLEGIHPVSSAVIFCFRTQIFVTRSDVVLVSGIKRGAPVIEGVFDSLGNALPNPTSREA